MIVARRVVIGGRVQGVGFRWFTRDTAAREGVSGWVCNLPDGRVEVLVEGESEAVTRVERALRRGPPGARVRTFTVEEEAPQRLQGPFAIIEGTSGRATRNV